MRIAMIAPLEMRVPPVGYGGTELIVSLLTEGLVRRGHQVTLFASGDSETSAELVSVCPRFLRGTGRDARVLTLLNAVKCLERSKDFDIIHNHTPYEGLALAGLVCTPMLTTLHGQPGPDEALLFQHYRGWHNAISHSARELLPPKERCMGVVYNAIDCSTYPFNPGPRQDFLLFLSRMSHEKGPHLAIEVARRAGMPLVLAGNVHGVDQEYFETQVLPHVDGHQVRYVGEADYAAKRELMAGARALLAPITWPEPFGLFMVEAMACGTPVIAFARGAAPEVVEDGVTGFVVGSVDEMVEAVHRLDEIDPRRARERVERLFDAPRMVDEYLAVYNAVLEEAAEGQGPDILPPRSPSKAPLSFRDTLPTSRLPRDLPAAG